MTSHRWVLTVSAVAGLSLLAVWWLRRPAGPTYHGRDTRGWLRVAEASDRSGTPPEVVQAFKAMGTNAVPQLLAVALDPGNDSPIRPVGRLLITDAPWVFQHLPARWTNWLTHGPTPGPAAFRMLCELHVPCVLTLPAANQWLASTNAETRKKGLTLLGTVSDGREQAARLLAPFLVTNAFWDNVAAGLALQDLGPAGVAALPEIIATFHDGASFPALGCVRTLGPLAKEALPALRHRFETEPVETIRLSFAMAAWAVDPEHFWADDLVRTALISGKNDSLRDEVIKLLDSQPSLLRRFAPALGVTIRTAPWRVALRLLQIIRSSDHNLEWAIPPMLEGLQSAYPEVQAAAVIGILKLQPTNPAALRGVANLLAETGSPEGMRERLLWELGHMGASATASLPAIRALAADTSTDIQAFAKGAIRAIEGAR